MVQGRGRAGDQVTGAGLDSTVHRPRTWWRVAAGGGGGRPAPAARLADQALADLIPASASCHAPPALPRAPPTLKK